MEAKRTVAHLSEDKAQCDHEHQSIAEEIEDVQKELRLSADRDAQGQDFQAAQINALGHRIIEMKVLLMPCKLRMESQRQEMCSQIQRMGAVWKNIVHQTENIASRNPLQDTDTPPSKPPTKNVTFKSRERSAALADLSQPQSCLQPSTSKVLPLTYPSPP